MYLGIQIVHIETAFLCLTDKIEPGNIWNSRIRYSRTDGVAMKQISNICVYCLLLQLPKHSEKQYDFIKVYNLHTEVKVEYSC